MLGICDIISRGKLAYPYEQMATVGSLDVVSLPTMSADTTISLTRDVFSEQEVVR